MSYCEDYSDPFPRDCEHGIPDGINCDDCLDEILDDDEEDDFDCAYPDECLMVGDHLRCECYTVEDAEEMDGGV